VVARPGDEFDVVDGLAQKVVGAGFQGSVTISSIKKFEVVFE
jgi:hypothetical protein